MIILITGPFYLILVINIRLNLHKAEKELSLTLEFNDTIIESQKVTGNKAKHILEDIENSIVTNPILIIKFNNG
ncbi:hypothetical protein BANRA_02803 [Escherichia coli]|nr:hypothetical protein [Escherichia coli]VCX02257.1 hypothetical protein BANRA_02803 [Escherichia coli]